MSRPSPSHGSGAARAVARTAWKPRGRWGFFIVSLTLAAMPSAWAGAAVLPGRNGKPQQVEFANQEALRVNTQVISVREVEAVFADSLLLIRDRIQRGELKRGQYEPAARAGWKKALQTSIQDALLDQLGERLREQIVRHIVRRAHPATPPRRLLEQFKRLEADEVRKLRKEKTAAAGGEEALRAALKRRGQRFQNWEAGLSREIFRRYVLFESVGPVAFSPAAARAYFQAHPGEFGRPDAWRLRRIKVPLKKFSRPEVAEKAIRLIHQKLIEGAGFAELAAQLDYDPPYGKQGGLLTVNGKTDLSSGQFPAEERIAAQLKDGAFSKPVRVAGGWVIVQREGYRPPVKMTFEQAAQRAAALAFSERIKQKKEEFFQRQKREAYIEITQKEPPKRWLKWPPPLLRP